MDPCETISVLFAFDENYAQHAAACIASLLQHNKARFEIVIACAGDPSPFADRLRRPLATNDRVTIDIKQFQFPEGLHFPVPDYLTLETYIRFWIGDVIPHRSRALYLDPDTIVTGSIEELWATDLRGNVLAAVPIPGSTRPQTHGMPSGSPFFNAGVLLIDLDAWRRRGYRDRCLDYLQRYPERAIDGDQDILNLCTMGDWLQLDYVWNAISPFYRTPYPLQLSQSEVQRVRDHARIIHFNGNQANKPWTYLGVHPRKADYLASLALTDWRDVRPPDLTLLNRVVKQLGPKIPGWAKRSGRAIVRAARALDKRGRAPSSAPLLSVPPPSLSE